MPVYAFECNRCWRAVERILPIENRDDAQACECGAPLARVQGGAHFRLSGGNPKINYADAFTADMMGVPVNSLPPNLRTKK